MKLTPFRHLEAAALRAKRFADGLVGELAQAVSGAVSELDEVKADKPEAVSVTIPATGWGSDSTAVYPKYYDIAVSGVTAKDRASVAIALAAQSTAAACGLCPVCETMAGKIRLRSASVPAAGMAANYWIEKGAG